MLGYLPKVFEYSSNIVQYAASYAVYHGRMVSVLDSSVLFGYHWTFQQSFC